MRPVLPVVPGHELPVTEFAKYQQQYMPLPSYRAENGMVTSRWKLGLVERIRVLFTGNLWIQSLTYGTPLQPVKPSTKPPNLENAQL